MQRIIQNLTSLTKAATTSNSLVNQLKINQVRNLAKKPFLPELNENELEESFLKGSGPGGQNVNKSTNCVQLRHTPTGITTTSHHTRSLIENRKIARRILQEKLDLLHNHQNSYLYQLKKEKIEKKNSQYKRSIENLERKREFKLREGISKPQKECKNERNETQEH